MKTGWKPVARGRIYCAPLCGRGCTKAEHRAAVFRSRDSDMLAEIGPAFL